MADKITAWPAPAFKHGQRVFYVKDGELTNGRVAGVALVPGADEEKYRVEANKQTDGVRLADMVPRKRLSATPENALRKMLMMFKRHGVEGA